MEGKDRTEMGELIYLSNYSAKHDITNLDNIVKRTNQYLQSYYRNELPVNHSNEFNREFQEPMVISSENVEEFEECLIRGDRKGLVLLYIEELEVKELLYTLMDEMHGIYESEVIKITNLKNKFRGLL